MKYKFVLLFLGLGLGAAQLVCQPGTARTSAQLLKAAESGDANAQFEIGGAYEDGKGVARDDRRAAEWFRKSAEQGNGQAQYSLGMMYAEGRGVERNRDEAIRWYKKAASHGVSQAMYSIAISYYNGEGAEENLGLAYTWLMAAQKGGDPRAQQALQQIGDQMPNRVDRSKFDLAELYEKGEELPQDLPSALALYREAAAKDPKSSPFVNPAELKLCEFYAAGKGVTQDFTAAKTWCVKAANAGNAPAFLQLGRMTEQGAGGEIPDPGGAVVWYRRAAAQMEVEAYMELGRLRAASPAHVDQKKAYFWFLLAQRQKYKGAEAKLNAAAAYLSNEEMDDELNQAIFWNKTGSSYRMTMANKH